MKVHPVQHIKKEVKREDKKLSTIERVTRVIALIIAFATVYFFFFKILFF